MAFTDYTGLSGHAFAVAALVVLAMAKCLPARLSAAHRLRCLRVAALATFALMLLPMPGAGPLAIYPRGIFGDLSIATLLLLALALTRRLESPFDCRPLFASRPQYIGVLAGVAVALYPFALGIGMFDPYRLGYASPVFIVGVAIVAGVALWRKSYFVALWLALAMLAWGVGWYESANLWDYLLDPLAGVYAVWVCVKWGVRCSPP